MPALKYWDALAGEWVRVQGDGPQGVQGHQGNQGNQGTQGPQGASLAGAWTVDGDDIYRPGGLVGFGTDDPLLRLDARGAAAKATTADLAWISQAASTDAADPLTVRTGVRTHATAADRYGAIEVDDGGTKRALVLQPGGGFVGVGGEPEFVFHIRRNKEPGILLTDIGGDKDEWTIRSSRTSFTGKRGLVFIPNATSTGSAVVKIMVDGKVGLGGEFEPTRILESKVGAGNPRADGWDTHSLSAYKRDIEPMDCRSVLARLCAAPPQRWTSDVGISRRFADEEEDNGEPIEKASTREPGIGIDDEEREVIRETVEVQRHGLVADTEAVLTNLPEVLSRDYETGEVGGIKLQDYIAVCHAAIVELSAQNKQLSDRLDKLERPGRP